ncbi:MAG: hypothetical protein IPM74_03610 [Crocinitomicaceae bacterium]|nr:hypothetical protein [Crocinitomicaceae bacterium]MBK8925000.1 hypothetical protein [Crocinitomicaceae bacterium]
MDEVIRNFEQAIHFHQRMVRRARMWAVISTITGISVIVIAYTMINAKNTEAIKTTATIGGLALSAIGLAWPLREIYNIKNRMEALNIFRQRYDGPPPPSDDEKKKIKDTVDTIINKSI